MIAFYKLHKSETQWTIEINGVLTGWMYRYEGQYVLSIDHDSPPIDEEHLGLIYYRLKSLNMEPK